MKNITKKKNKSIEDDCPAIILKTAKTPWQKEVALEFVKYYNRLDELKHELKWIKWLVVTLFVVIVIQKVIP